MTTLQENSSISPKRYEQLNNACLNHIANETVIQRHKQLIDIIIMLGFIDSMLTQIESGDLENKGFDINSDGDLIDLIYASFLSANYGARQGLFNNQNTLSVNETRHIEGALEADIDFIKHALHKNFDKIKKGGFEPKFKGYELWLQLLTAILLEMFSKIEVNEVADSNATNGIAYNVVFGTKTLIIEYYLEGKVSSAGMVSKLDSSTLPNIRTLSEDGIETQFNQIDQVLLNQRIPIFISILRKVAQSLINSAN